MPEGAQLLLVEDDRDSRVSVAALLRTRGYYVITAVDGEQAIQLARQRRPCLILLDVMMPLMDGHEFRQTQLADPVLAHIPIVLMSGHDDVAELAKTLGAVGYVRKPIIIDDLVKVIDAHCKRVGPDTSA